MPEFAERFFRSGSLRIHVRDWGDTALPSLVLVHGLRDHSHSFDDIARGLLDRFHVLAIDLRGHGDSETTPYYEDIFSRICDRVDARVSAVAAGSWAEIDTPEDVPSAARVARSQSLEAPA